MRKRLLTLAFTGLAAVLMSAWPVATSLASRAR